MISYSDFNLELLPDISFTRTNKNNYGELPLALDIETTSTKYQGDKCSFMYIWQLGITKDLIIYGRTWGELITLLFNIKSFYGLNGEKTLIIYCHNLGYEFQFMRKYINFKNVFSVNERKPLKAVTDLGLEFRDSYILSGHSLENLAKNLKDKSTKKLVGDLDYSLIRHSETPLTDQELKYCENDIIIVLQYIYEQIDIYGSITKIPLTNTGRVRTFTRNNCYYTSSNHKKTSAGKYKRYRRVMEDLTLTTSNYIQLKTAFMGGFTHSNPAFTGETLNDVDSIDLSSSYPTVMLADKFPMSRGKEINNIDTVEELEKLFINNCVVFDLHLEGVENILLYESYISESKCKSLVNPIINNGRVYRADSLAITLTDVDYNILTKVYEWDKIAIKNVVAYRKAYLPKPIIESILKLYADKTTLKDVKGSEVEYLLSKCMLNSVYGMTVTDIVKDEVIYDGEWGTEPVTIDEKIEEYNTSRNRFLFYAWGVWVTAYARRNLWTGILNIGDDYIYSDTDSIKMVNYKSHTKFIESYNKKITNDLEKMIKELKLDIELLKPKSKDGKLKPMGVWDYEGHYKLFKTLGAKRYIYLEGEKLNITVAGLSKQNGVKYLLDLYKTPKNVIDNFDDNLYIPADKTGKMTHTYLDNEQDLLITDYLGNHLEFNVKSSIHLENTEFTLSISKQYKTFLENLSQGLIYRGLNHI